MKKILAPLLLLCTVSAHAQESKVVLPVKTVYLNRMFDLATIEGREVSIEYDRTAPGKLWIAFSWDADEGTPSDTITFTLNNQQLSLKGREITTTERVFAMEYTVNVPAVTTSAPTASTLSTTSPASYTSTIVNADGTHSTMISSGTTGILVNPDGTHTVMINTGSTGTVINPNGTHSTIINHGSTSTIINPNGTHSTVIHHGNTNTVVNPDGTHTNIIRNGNTTTVVGAQESDSKTSKLSFESRTETCKKELMYTHLLIDTNSALLNQLFRARTMALTIKLSGKLIRISLSRKQLNQLKLGLGH